MKAIRLATVGFIMAFLCAAMGAQAQVYTTLGTFDGTNGWNPNGLIEAANGNLIGTTLYGGTGSGGTDGTLFEITTAGSRTAIYNFCLTTSCSDGAWPNSPILASDGNYYGTTQVGAPNDRGVVYKISPLGQLSVIYNFCAVANCADGFHPIGPLVEGRNGNLYGITAAGGSPLKDYCPYEGCGTIFEITTSGTLTTLHSFCSNRDCSDGWANLGASLTLATDGNFYGTTPEMTRGNGTFFRMSAAGEFTTMHRFCYEGSSCSVQNPLGVVEGSDGNFYGLAFGQNGAQAGVVFKITSTGPSVIYSFCSLANCADGQEPTSGLIQGSDGNFYGTTELGGNPACISGCGTMFQITPAGELTTLYDFCSLSGCADGEYPTAILTQHTNGLFYGTTEAGGDLSCNSNDSPSGCGTIFSLGTGLAPFVSANPAFGKVGRTVWILGDSLTGTSGVTFNGIGTTFTVVSDTLIKAAVPTGATTGTIQVTTPSGTLSSNVAFQVLP